MKYRERPSDPRSPAKEVLVVVGVLSRFFCIAGRLPCFRERGGGLGIAEAHRHDRQFSLEQDKWKRT